MVTTNSNVIDPPARPLMPVGFIGHGSPMNALEHEGAAAAWRAWGASLPRPRSILIVSAHWLDSPPVVSGQQTLPLIYDFYGFPQELYQVRYAAPGEPDIARQVFGLLDVAGLGLKSDPIRGLDHGAWVPLSHMFPKADIPVVQVSIGTRVPMRDHVALGRVLVPLRAEGVFILGGGNIVHNLRLAKLYDKHAAPDTWVTEFDAWCAEEVERFEVDALADYAAKAPGARLAVPTDDDYTPFLFAMAAASLAANKPSVRYPYTAIEYNLSMRCVELS